jgi:hypothetical protein
MPSYDAAPAAPCPPADQSTHEDKDYVHIVMELCEGGELFDSIVEAGNFRWAAARLKRAGGALPAPRSGHRPRAAVCLQQLAAAAAGVGCGGAPAE